LEALHVRAPQALFAACVKPMSEKSRRYPRSELTRMPPAVITFQKNRLTITCLASRERPRWGARERDEVAIE
jgi:hypothetical protein